MSRSKKKERKDPRTLLSIIQSVVADWEATGSTFTHMNLYPTRFGLGIVFDRSWMCEKCGNYQYEDLADDLICEECKKKK